MSTDGVTLATANAHFRMFAVLVREYVEWSRQRYAGNPWFADAVFGHQSIERELETLPSSYGPPRGRAFLARSQGLVAGCVAYRKRAETTCEMKRLFVRGGNQGRGIGRQLCVAAIDAARSDGYTLMRLDTANLFTEAIGLYRSVGFQACPAYNAYPAEIMPHIVFMEMPLLPGANG